MIINWRFMVNPLWSLKTGMVGSILSLGPNDGRPERQHLPGKASFKIEVARMTDSP